MRLSGLEKLAKYAPPYTLAQIRKNYPKEVYERLLSDPTHSWRADSGIELRHQEPTYAEQVRTHKNWLRMSDDLKALSDAKSVELQGLANLAAHARAMKYRARRR